MKMSYESKSCKKCNVQIQKFSGQTEFTNLAGFLSPNQFNISNKSGDAHISGTLETHTLCIGGEHFG